MSDNRKYPEGSAEALLSECVTKFRHVLSKDLSQRIRALLDDEAESPTSPCPKIILHGRTAGYEDISMVDVFCDTENGHRAVEDIAQRWLEEGEADHVEVYVATPVKIRVEDHTVKSYKVQMKR